MQILSRCGDVKFKFNFIVTDYFQLSLDENEKKEKKIKERKKTNKRK